MSGIHTQGPPCRPPTTEENADAHRETTETNQPTTHLAEATPSTQGENTPDWLQQPRPAPQTSTQNNTKATSTSKKPTAASSLAVDEGGADTIHHTPTVDSAKACGSTIPPFASVHTRSNHRPSISYTPARSFNHKVCDRLARCYRVRAPVIPTTGEAILECVDFRLPGPLPLHWRRIYRSGNGTDRGMGCGWTADFVSRLRILENEVQWEDGEGRRVSFAKPFPGESTFQALEKTWLHRDERGRYQLTTEENVHHCFRGQGQVKRLHKLCDRNGNTIELQYNIAGQLYRLIDSCGRSLGLSRDDKGRINQIFLCDDQGQPLRPALASYQYNEQGDLVCATDRGNDTEQYQYEHHAIVKKTTKTGFVYRFEWDRHDIHGKCLRSSGENEIYATHFEYYEEAGITKCLDSRGGIRELHYNPLGKVTRDIDPEGGITRNDYDDAGNLVRSIDPEGHNTRFEYNERGKLITHIDALGHTTHLEYDSRDQPVKLIDPIGNTWRQFFDTHGNLTAIQDALNHTTQYHYYRNGLLKYSINAMGNTTHYRWNAKQELKEIVVYDHARLAKSNPAGASITNNEYQRIRWQYDSLGNVTQISDAAGQVTHYGYDACNRMVFIKLADGQEHHMRYNAEGQLLSYRDGGGRVTEYRYDGLSQPILRKDPCGQSLHFQYDSERNLIALLNENGDSYHFVYDKNSKLIQETGFDGRKQAYDYDRAGQLLRQIENDKRIIEYRRDPLGRLLQQKSADGDTCHYRYDALGRLIVALNPAAKLEFEYDAVGNLTSETQNKFKIRYQYNKLRQKTKIILASGEAIAIGLDHHGRLSSASLNDKVIVQIQRDVLGREKLRRSGAVHTASQHDPLGRLTQQRAKRGEFNILNRDYSYDASGNLRYINDYKYGEIFYRYDPLNRLISVAGQTDERFRFDPAGNLMDANFRKSHGFVHGNLLPRYQDHYFDYDRSGNLVRERTGLHTTLFQYNHMNQLIRAKRDQKLTAYSYDPLGRRISKQDKHAKTQFIWSGDQLLLEQHADRRILYIYEPDRFKPIAKLEDQQLYYYHNDHIGTPQVLTNERGEIAWAATYYANGEIAKYHTQQIDNALRFQGQYHDTETGLHYNRNRYYHPKMGRYTTVDPIGLAGGSNLYRYASNPITWVDPLGLTAECEAVGAMLPRKPAEPLLTAYATKRSTNPTHTCFSNFNPITMTNHAHAAYRLSHKPMSVYVCESTSRLDHGWETRDDDFPRVNLAKLWNR